jgi:hypothetical protein
MVAIPPKLRREEFRFIPLKSRDKIPFEKEWGTINNYRYDDSRLSDHLSRGGNYGVVCGFGGLIVIDFDSEEVQNQVVGKLPKTFTVRAGRGLSHKYFFSDRTDSFKILAEDGRTLADIQGKGKQEVSPGSIHPNGKVYEVVNDSDIAFIRYDDLLTIFEPFRSKNQKTLAKENPHRPNSPYDEIRSLVKIPDLLREYGISLTPNPGVCPIGHESDRNKCFHHSEFLWHCFHCGLGGDVFKLVMAKEKCNFPKAMEILTQKALTGVYQVGGKTPKSQSITTKLRSNFSNLFKRFLSIPKISSRWSFR